MEKFKLITYRKRRSITILGKLSILICFIFVACLIAGKDLSYDTAKWWNSSRGFRTVMNEALAYLYAKLFFHPDKEKIIEEIKTGYYEDYLFIPFRDKTSCNESYGGGRYMDFRIPETDSVTIDFNLSYNLYCTYNHKYSCPIPPAENSLPVKILAGEKAYK